MKKPVSVVDVAAKRAAVSKKIAKKKASSVVSEELQAIQSEKKPIVIQDLPLELQAIFKVLAHSPGYLSMTKIVNLLLVLEGNYYASNKKRLFNFDWRLGGFGAFSKEVCRYLTAEEFKHFYTRKLIMQFRTNVYQLAYPIVPTFEGELDSWFIETIRFFINKATSTTSTYIRRDLPFVDYTKESRNMPMPGESKMWEDRLNKVRTTHYITRPIKQILPPL